MRFRLEWQENTGWTNYWKVNGEMSRVWIGWVEQPKPSGRMGWSEPNDSASKGPQLRILWTVGGCAVIVQRYYCSGCSQARGHCSPSIVNAAWAPVSALTVTSAICG